MKSFEEHLRGAKAHNREDMPRMTKVSFWQPI